jgi:hypothetical protein
MVLTIHYDTMEREREREEEEGANEDAGMVVQDLHVSSQT